MNAQALPVTPIERVRAAVRDYLDTPESYPLVLPARDDLVQDRLNERHAKQERRKYTGEPISRFGDIT